VKECVDVLWWLLNNREVNGIFNLGTGRPGPGTISSGGLCRAGTPAQDRLHRDARAIRGQYQYFTEARMDKLRAQAARVPFIPLEDSVGDYVRNHLLQADPYL